MPFIKNLKRYLVYIPIFVLAPVFTGIGNSLQSNFSAIKQLIAFTLYIILFETFCLIFRKVASARGFKISLFTLLLLCTCLFLFTLQFLEWQTSKNTLYLTLGLSLVRLLDLLYAKRNILLSIILNWIYLTALILTTFQIQLHSFHWQALVLSTSFACMLSTLLLALQLGEMNASIVSQGANGHRKSQNHLVSIDHLLLIFRVLILLGPTLLCILCYFKQIPSYYLLILIIYPMSLPLLNLKYPLPKSNQLISRTTGIYWLYVLILFSKLIAN